jgi:hypothetical protein
VIMNPYTSPSSTVVRQLFVSEPFYNTIAVLDLITVGTRPTKCSASDPSVGSAHGR